MESFECDSPWLRLALTHRSVSSQNNERLEFVGDALLGFVLAEEIYRRYPEADEGTMTLMRSRLVNRNFLATVARERNLDGALRQRLPGPEQYLAASTNVLAGVFEAWFAAVYFERGMEYLRQLVQEIYRPYWRQFDQQGGDKFPLLKTPKTILQEYLQKRGYALPSYSLLRTEGRAHQLVFHVECRIHALDIVTVGTGMRQRYAESTAAQQAYEQLILVVD